jgi:2-polyprenyl-6-methoxyphenol hydroxylase-like FAD-dependent oxidoreductase
MKRYDAVIVGARVAGSALAIELARGEWRVLLVDRDEFPSDTLSTHGLWPNAIARLEALGALELLRARHRLHPSELRWRAFAHEFSGAFTPVGGHRHCIAPRRSALDAALLDTALAAGANARPGTRVAALLGSGTEPDPVRGVIIDGGERIESRWVIGADGRASTVARALGLAKTSPLRAEMAMMFAYWRGLPPTPFMHFHGESDGVLAWAQCEDDVHLVILNCRPELTTGGAEARERAYLDGIRRFPETLEPEWLEGAVRISGLRTAPETMLRGYFRQATGPGWALVGDAGHFKHPSTAQGIGDALEQAHQVAKGLLGADPELSEYGRWRDRRALEHYEWSFNFGRLPRPEFAEPMYAGIAADETAAQDFRDVFTRRVDPRTQLLTDERRDRWFAATTGAGR